MCVNMDNTTTSMTHAASLCLKRWSILLICDTKLEEKHCNRVANRDMASGNTPEYCRKPCGHVLAGWRMMQKSRATRPSMAGSGTTGAAHYMDS